MLARFVPIVRTFAPIVAGVGTMRYRTFVIYNIIGAALWAVGITTLGYFLGSVDVVKNNIEIAIVAIIAVSLLPVTIELIRHRRQARHAPRGRRHDRHHPGEPGEPARLRLNLRRRSPLRFDRLLLASLGNASGVVASAPAEPDAPGSGFTRSSAAPGGAR